VLGQFPRKHEANGGLDLAATERRLLVVSGELASFGSNALKDVVDEGVHDGHALLGDASVWVNLLEHLVDVTAVRLRALFRLFGAASSFLGGCCFRRLLGWCLGHGCECLFVACC